MTITPTTPALPANARRGEVTADFGGQPRTFWFNMNALIAFGDLHGGSPSDFGAIFQTNTLKGLRDMAYCGLLSNAAANNLPVDFSPETVGEWISDAEQAQWDKVQAVMLANLTPGKKQPEATATTPAQAPEPTA